VHVVGVERQAAAEEAGNDNDGVDAVRDGGLVRGRSLERALP
jgi:hypothetical protein